MVASYIPKRGDIVWVNFNPALGHEQKNLRPALVLSPQNYNQKTGLLVCCPVTSKIKGYPFEVKIMLDGKAGVILTDQLRTLDWQARYVSFIQEVTKTVLADVQEKVKALILS
ncbi:MAG: endoribonuclease MazF [Candidatus Parcubacteria bacterium]|jgi:mRNA interferase MazF